MDRHGLNQDDRSQPEVCMSGSSTSPKRPKPKWIDQTTFHTGYQTIPKNGPIVGTKTKDEALGTNQPKPVRTIVSVFRKDAM
jgi:hypothetical protein